MPPAGKLKIDPSVLEALAPVFIPAEPTLRSGYLSSQAFLLLAPIRQSSKHAHWLNRIPKLHFHLRIYASACLAHASSGTVEQDTFWDQILSSLAALSSSHRP